MKMHINISDFKNATLAMFGFIFYVLLLDYSYSTIIYKIYGYYGYENIHDVSQIFRHWIMIIAISPLMIKTYTKKNVSSVIIIVLVLVSFIPNMILIKHSNYNAEYAYLTFAYWFTLLGMNLILPSIKYSINKPNRIISLAVITIICLTVLYVSITKANFRIHLTFSDVYVLRVEARSFSLPLFLGYFGTAAHTVLPIAFIYSLVEKKKYSALLLAIVIMLNFGIAGSKSVVLLLFIATLGYIFSKRISDSANITWGFGILIAIAVVEHSILKSNNLTFFTLFRTLFLPGIITYNYYDYFSINDFDYLKQGVLKIFGAKSIYSDNIAFMIGDYMSSVRGGRANNGLFSDAYSNVGTIGVVFFPIIIVLLLKTIERSVNGLDKRLIFIVAVTTAMNLLSVPVFTSVATGGLFLMTIYLLYLPRFNSEQVSR
jgi:hypothetical protein